MNVVDNIFFTEVTLNGVAIVLLLVSLISLSVLDVKTKRVPNKYLIVLLAASLFFSAIAGFHQLVVFFTGLFVGGMLFMLPYLLAWIGGADIKVFAVIGSVIGYSAVIDAFIYTLIVGMLFAVFISARNALQVSLIKVVCKTESSPLQNMPAKESMNYKFAYLPAITLGTFLALLRPLEITL